MWLSILEAIFKIVVVLMIGIVLVVYIMCKYDHIEPPKEEKKKTKNKKVKEGK